MYGHFQKNILWQEKYNLLFLQILLVILLKINIIFNYFY